MRLAHDPPLMDALRQPTPDEPLRVLASGCLGGRGCGVDGTDYGLGGAIPKLLSLPSVAVQYFCPEAHTLGVPRTTPDIHGGDGFDVLDGRARVLDEHGEDLTRAMLDGASAMLAEARRAGAELAILTDISAACATQVVSDGCRFVEGAGAPDLAVPVRKYRRGVGVAAARLIRAGIPVVSQRDDATLERLRAILVPGHQPDPAARDHHEREWYRTYFSVEAEPC